MATRTRESDLFLGGIGHLENGRIVESVDSRDGNDEPSDHLFDPVLFPCLAEMTTGIKGTSSADSHV
jgi:hypothetical protein